VLGDVVAFLATADPVRSRDFYEGSLGLRLVADEEFALVFEFVEQDPRGIWTAPGGARVAWFRDPD
jgi:catechol 2,3-dioxygenase-like lactoylglutathione lyase family enzyme